MKITIVSSLNFAKEIIKIKDTLEKTGHQVSIPPDTEDSLKNPNLNMDLEFCIQQNLLHKCFKRIENHDAILVLNYKKDDIEGYVGGASLMEIGLAFYLNKKIFLLNPLPSTSKLRYVCEIKQAKPIIINNDLSLIK